MQGGSSSLFSIIIIIIPIIIVVWFFSKRKKKQEGAGFQGKLKSDKKDEVWRTIKQYMKDNGESGKEVAYSFVAKRPNPLQDKKLRKNYEVEIKKYIKENNLNKAAAKKYKRQKNKEASRELYCIYFITRDPKTKTKDSGKIIEAEVIQKPTGNKKEPTKRTIVVNGLQDFDKEFKWIEPIKKREDEKIAKLEKQRAARQAKKDARKKKFVKTKKAKKSDSSTEVKPFAN